MSVDEEVRFQIERGDFGPGSEDAQVKEMLALYRRRKATSWERTIAGTGRTIEVCVAPTPQGGYVSILTNVTVHKRHEGFE